MMPLLESRIQFIYQVSKLLSVFGSWGAATHVKTKNTGVQRTNLEQEKSRLGVGGP